jgi:DnaJ-class molecular chaperone
LESFKDQKSQAIFDEVKNLATHYINKYLSDRPELFQDREHVEENFDQWMWVYQILLLPEYLLVELLFKQNEKQCKSNFRKLCILVHPDKNTHELASRAFQRLLTVFQSGP